MYLLLGGYSNVNQIWRNTSEIFDGATWRSIGGELYEEIGGCAVALDENRLESSARKQNISYNVSFYRVMVFGGHNGDNYFEPYPYILDLTTEAWTIVAPMNRVRKKMFVPFDILAVTYDPQQF